MSTFVMGRCWPLQMSPSAKFVLISLADNANDHGACWPSISTICTRTCLGRTAVIEAIKQLELLGLVVGDRSNGRHTRYTVVVGQGGLFESQVAAQPVRQTNRSGTRTGLRRELDQSGSRTGPVRQADTNRQEPSLTVNGESGALRDLEFAALADHEQRAVAPYADRIPASISLELWAAFVAHRAVMRRVLSTSAFLQVLPILAALEHAGHNLNACLRHTMLHGLAVPCAPPATSATELALSQPPSRAGQGRAAATTATPTGATHAPGRESASDRSARLAAEADERERREFAGLDDDDGAAAA